MGVMVRPCAVTPGRTAPPPLRLASKLASLAASPIKEGGISKGRTKKAGRSILHPAFLLIVGRSLFIRRSLLGRRLFGGLGLFGRGLGRSSLFSRSGLFFGLFCGGGGWQRVVAGKGVLRAR